MNRYKFQGTMKIKFTGIFWLRRTAIITDIIRTDIRVRDEWLITCMLISEIKSFIYALALTAFWLDHHWKRAWVCGDLTENQGRDYLTHWGRVTHKQIIIGLDNGLWPGWRQVIIWTNAGILSIGNLGTNFSETSIEIYTFSFKECVWKWLLQK